MYTLRLRAASSVVHVGADSASARNWAGADRGRESDHGAEAIADQDVVVDVATWSRT
jgi:hypothetical protein